MKLCHRFVDLERAFDPVPRKMIVWAVRRPIVPEIIVSVMLSLYEQTKSMVSTAAGTSEKFAVGVDQRSTLRPLFCC